MAYFGGQAVFCGCLSGEFVSTFNCGTLVMMHLMGYWESEYFPTNRIVGGDYCSNVVKRRFHPICVPLCFLVDPCSSSVKHLKLTNQKKKTVQLKKLTYHLIFLLVFGWSSYLFCYFAQHIVFGMTAILAWIIPDVPKEVDNQVKRENFLAREALRSADQQDSVSPVPRENSRGQDEMLWNVVECRVLTEIIS